MTNDNSTDELRSLWQDQPIAPFQMTPDEIRLKMQRLNRKLLIRDSLLYVICIGETVWFSYCIVALPVPAIFKVGCLLIIIAVGFFAGQIWLAWRDRSASHAMAAASGKTGSVDFYRDELVRQRNFHRGVWFWSRFFALLPGLLVFGIWAIVAFPKAAIGYGLTAATLILSALAVWLNRKKSFSYQRQIDAIDILQRPPE